MGHKVNPISLRLIDNRNWKSNWFSKRDYAKFLHQDLEIRQAIEDSFAQAGIADIRIERRQKDIVVTVYSSRPGMIIGHSGEGASKLNLAIEKITKAKAKVKVEVMEVKRPDLEARLMADSIVYQLLRRMPFRRVVKQAIEKIMFAGAKGARIRVAGRLGGVEIARNETMQEGSVPLHTLRADIDYACLPAKTTNVGTIGVKVWINRGIKVKKRIKSNS
ncbi:MAG: small subunit ribosomal protein S3 [Candidatus Berkelbacteria bacterium Licking1014_96]|uniref:Small ribosomal subunit protein uS3 n=1 Tax=Candidatus Berkelbacteria bacterium Licking1014_96 TaxID=2017149 RepID=A0A554LE79_9BACT|nr:MAG: small subunit ribosomal protein S3 [Candidatus Berkelbacteria bacterium Licking1014_96]